MSNFTINQIIDIAKISQYLSENDIDNKGLWGGGMDLLLPQKIYAVRKNVEWQQTVNPSTQEATATATISILDIGIIGDTIEVYVIDPEYGDILLGIAERTEDIISTTQLAEAIADAINTNVYGYTATFNGSIVTITGRPETGASLNGNNLYVSITSNLGTEITTESSDFIITENIINLITE